MNKLKLNPKTYNHISELRLSQSDTYLVLGSYVCYKPILKLHSQSQTPQAFQMTKITEN